MSEEGETAVRFAGNPGDSHAMQDPVLPPPVDNGTGRIDKPSMVPRSELERVELELAISREETKMFEGLAEKLQATLETKQRELSEAKSAAVYTHGRTTASAQGWALMCEAAIKQRDEARSQKDHWEAENAANLANFEKAVAVSEKLAEQREHLAGMLNQAASLLRSDESSVEVCARIMVLFQEGQAAYPAAKGGAA